VKEQEINDLRMSLNNMDRNIDQL
jgi:chromosome segregation ATPase